MLIWYTYDEAHVLAEKYPGEGSWILERYERLKGTIGFCYLRYLLRIRGDYNQRYPLFKVVSERLKKADETLYEMSQIPFEDIPLHMPFDKYEHIVEDLLKLRLQIGK